MKKKNTKNQEPNKNTISDRLFLPKDIVKGASILTGIGREELWIENYRGILEYTESMIMIQGRKNRIIIEGTGLSIDYYSNEDMRIIGCINAVKYQ